MERITRAAAVFGIRRPKNLGRLVRHILAYLLLIGASTPTATAATLTSASVSLTTPVPSATSVGYDFAASSFSNLSIKCVKVLFATTATGSTKPSGMVTASGISIDATSDLLTAANWSRGGADPDGTVTFTYATGETPSAAPHTYKLDGFTNSSTADTQLWMHFSTFDNVDCATTPRDSKTVQFILTAGSDLSLTVDPTLSFSVNAVAASQSCNGTTTTQPSTSTALSFASITTASNGVVCQDLTAATNASNGYTVFTRFTGQPSNGADTIDDHAGSNTTPTTFSSPGTESYGYSTDDSVLSTCGGSCNANRFTNGGQKWAAMTTSNAEIGFESASASSTTYRIGHQAGISATTPGGTYSTTIIYTCTPVY